MGCCISKSTIQPVIVDNSQNFRSKNVSSDLKITYNDLKSIDDHALQTPKYVENSITELADYLAKPAKSELETIRSFYVWICNNISYNATAFFSGTSAVTEPSGVLKSKSSVCEGYARLFQALCVAKNIKCQKISGFSKGYGHQLGTILSYQNKTDHAWNVVFVSGKWRFIETTWGAGHINKKRTFVKEFSNFYFLTKPEHFIEDHFPYINNDVEGSKEWQLLRKPVSLEEFSKTLKTTNVAREWDVIFPSNKNEVVKADRKASISMESKQVTLTNVSVNLYGSSRELCNESVVIVKNNFSNYTITITPRKIGKYMLQIFGTVDESQHVMPNLTEYLIECTSIEDEFMPYPEHSGFYGPSTDCKLRGFANSESISAFQICQNGEFEFLIKTNKTVKCSADIFETDGSRSSDFVMVEQSNDSVCVKTRFVSKGYYKITLFSELEGNDTYSEAMNILVLNKKAAKIATPFPQTYSSTNEYNCHLIEPLVRNIPSNSNVRFAMSSPVIQQLLIDGKVHKKENDKLWDITVKTGYSGVLTVSAKKDNNINSYSYIYQYVVD
ncbi:kyphoscoliosis peptidase-like [Mytilus californianus]|uniref:kyphoscoliosis peptidase-like n=1 Tax=Mytilus californianus TaxID=6549 RepID=UPI0022473DF5|nr:kyphoscoliosis peptidase-like [Mytilus californianus]XP_052088561.1 kyphoscoliosis peptidase-like [Mytilus californianus]XP_052088562.1 kyphoscoliosis peptidase-like [Mytilus californianus]